MATSSHGNIFCVTGPLWGESTGHRWIPLANASDAELWCFLWSAPEHTVEQTSEDAGDLRRYPTHYDINVVMHHSTHWGLLTHIRFREQWLVACSVPSHYLNQCWLINNRVRGANFSKILIITQKPFFEELNLKMSAKLRSFYWCNKMLTGYFAKGSKCFYLDINQFLWKWKGVIHVPL